MIVGHAEFDRFRALTGLAPWLALIVLLAAGCGGGNDEPAEDDKPRSALVPGALDDTLYAPADTSAWRQMEGTRPDESVLSSDPEADGSAMNESAEPSTPSSAATSKDASVTRSAATAEGFVLQLGSFRDLDNARRQAERLRELGHDPILEASVLGGQTYHRVVLRGLPDHSAASALGEKIHAELGITYLVRRAR